jgi:hypothetical protein
MACRGHCRRGAQFRQCLEVCIPQRCSCEQNLNGWADLKYAYLNLFEPLNSTVIQVRWEDWSRSDGTNTTWMHALPDRPSLVRLWTRRQARRRENLASLSLSIDLGQFTPEDLVHEQTILRAQAYDEKLARHARIGHRVYEGWDECECQARITEALGYVGGPTVRKRTGLRRPHTSTGASCMSLVDARSSGSSSTVHHTAPISISRTRVRGDTAPDSVLPISRRGLRTTESVISHKSIAPSLGGL